MKMQRQEVKINQNFYLTYASQWNVCVGTLITLKQSQAIDMHLKTDILESQNIMLDESKRQ